VEQGKAGSNLLRDVRLHIKEAPIWIADSTFPLEPEWLDCDSPAFQVTDANDFIHFGQKYLSIPDLPSGGGLDNRIDGGADLSVVDHELHFDLG
jgi:hypothetical protein